MPTFKFSTNLIIKGLQRIGIIIVYSAVIAVVKINLSILGEMATGGILCELVPKPFW